MPASQSKAKAIFLQAVEMPSSAQRQEYLDGECRNDAALRREVEELLRHFGQMSSFLEPSASAPYATVDDTVRERPGTMIGSYKLLEEIGEGGFGIVFMAEQQQPLRRKVALKILKPGMDTRQVIARFEAERQALALMDHANIARVFDGGETDTGRPYFVMELVKGIPITDFCDQSQLSIRERLELFVHVCQAVQHAHQKGIIHRDLKPSNVLVTLHDGEPLVKIIDFGIAKALGQQLTDKTLFTGFAQMIGTPLYMSPEQAALSNVDVDTRSDIYSLGVLLYELLTGATPFDSQRLKEVDYDEMRRIIREEEPLKPSTRISTLGQAATMISTQRQSDSKRLSQLFRGELDWIVMKCLEKDRNRRYETANGLARDIERYLHDEPVQAYPPSALYRLGKFARRNKAALSIAALILLVVITVACGIGWIIRDRAAQQAFLQQEVTRALEEADSSYNSELLPEALAAVKRAEGLLATGVGDELLRQQVGDRRRDLEIVLRLEDIRLQGAAPKAKLVDYQRADASYADTFRDLGIEIDALHPAEAGARIRRRTVPVKLAAALDDWALARRFAKTPVQSIDEPAHRRGGWTHLVAIAQEADFDPRRRQIRDAWVQGDSRELKRLAASTGVGDLPVQTLILLAFAFADGKDRVDFLQKVQPRHPNDFWLNFYLATNLERVPGTSIEEVIGLYRVCLAVRPQSSLVYGRLGVALINSGRIEEAIAALKEAVRLDPNYASGHQSLCYLLSSGGDPDDAILHCRQAIRLLPRPSGAYANLGFLLHKKGLALADEDLLDQAIAAYRNALSMGRSPGHGDVVQQQLAALLIRLARLGKYRRAAAEANVLSQRKAALDVDLYHSACIYAQCAAVAAKDGNLRQAERGKLAQDYAAHAVALLHHAVAMGFRGVAPMKNDADLDPLRRRDDFRKLLRELEGKAKGKH